VEVLKLDMLSGVNYDPYNNIDHAFVVLRIKAEHEKNVGFRRADFKAFERGRGWDAPAGARSGGGVLGSTDALVGGSPCVRMCSPTSTTFSSRDDEYRNL
jgi:hypothetical protein